MLRWLQAPKHTIHAAAGPFWRALRILCGVVLLVSALDLLGWWFHQPGLVRIVPSSASMKPNTALCLLLLAFASLGKQGNRRLARAADVLCCCAIAVAAATLVEFWTGHSFGIDEVLAHVPAELAGNPPGRMSQGTAIDGLLSGLALLLLDAAPVLGSYLAALASLLSLAALVGLLFDAGPLRGVPLLSSMAVGTATSFVAVQVAYFLLRPNQEPTRSLLHSARYHRMGPWFVVGTCLLPLLLGWPVAALYRHGMFEATFAFAVLVVLLMAAQAVLTMRNSRSLVEVQGRRDRAEEQRQLLEVENERQFAVLAASEQRAARSEALYRLITDALPALVSYLDHNLRYVRANRTYGDWFGVPAEQSEGKTIEEVLGPSAEGIRIRLEAALRGEPQQFEARMQTMQGERVLSISHIPDRDAAGKVRGVVVQATDITMRRQAEAALRQTEKLAAVGKLASSIAHEINNPLEAVTNLLYLAKDETRPELIREYLTTAEEELGRVSAIASQTLRFHKQSTKPRPVRAAELFESVVAIYRPRLTGRVEVEMRHRAADPITCMDGEIRQVLNNLVGNAIDAMHGRPGRLRVRSRMAASPKTGERGLVMTVADSGTGMNAETVATIFEAFFTTKGIGGTGLGLWVSKEIIDRHHGSLRVRSSPAAEHHGTVFRLFLPYCSALVG